MNRTLFMMGVVALGVGCAPKSLAVATGPTPSFAQPASEPGVAALQPTALRREATIRPAPGELPSPPAPARGRRRAVV